MIRTIARAELRDDGLLDVTYYGEDGIPIAVAEGYASGEEADTAFREYIEQLEAERNNESPEEVTDPTFSSQ